MLLQIGILLIIALVSASLTPVSPEEEEELKDYARFSSIASCQSSSILMWNCGPLCTQLPGVTVISYFSNLSTDGVGFIAKRNNDLLIVFRASSTLINWIYNLEILQDQVPWNKAIDPSISVHRGFYETYMSVRQQVRNGVQQNYKVGMRMVFVGHSLGGALATLALSDLVEEGIVPTVMTRLITFGSPRIGNAAWMNYFQDRFSPISTRVTNKRDLVPHLPPQNPIIPYFQVTREWWFTHTNSGGASQGWKCSPDNAEDPLCSDQFDFYVVDDHFSFLGVVFGCAPQFIPLHWRRAANL